jgi:2'-5' RNA ligase
MIDLGGYRREERGYTPHVTLGRIQGDAPVPPALLTAVAQPPASPLGHMTAREVQVLSSELKAEGPVYTVLSRAKLGGK